MRRTVAFLLFSLLALGVLPSAAAADGLPVPMDGFGPTTTIVRPDGDGPRYATVRAGGDTNLLRIDQDGGEITGTRRIEGSFTVPLVALDGTASGLSADGSTLALISPRTDFGSLRRETSFLIVDLQARHAMRPHEPLTLRGDFSFDALSPDASTMYLIEYTSRDFNDYAVREYDLRRQRLLPDPILVSHEVAPGEMRGMPMTSATSSDGRWVYTLYNGGGRRSDVPFIHTLDTTRSLSHCIDLPMINGQQAWRIDLALSGDGGVLNVVRGGETLATLNTENFGLSEPTAPEPAPPAAASEDGGLSGLAIGAIGAGLVLLAATGFLVRRPRRAPAALPADPFGSDDAHQVVEPEREGSRVN